jgi:hypothetical protein
MYIDINVTEHTNVKTYVNRLQGCKTLHWITLSTAVASAEDKVYLGTDRLQVMFYTKEKLQETILELTKMLVQWDDNAKVEEV